MEKRTILAIILSVIILFGFQFYQQRYMKPPLSARQTSSTAEAPKQELAETPVAPGVAPTSATIAAPIVSATDTKAKPQSITIEADHYKAVLDNHGGIIASWILKGYKAEKGLDFEMISENNEISHSRLFPGALLLRDPSLTALANNECYEVSINGSSSNRTVISAPATVVLTFKRGDLAIKKEYRFEKENYLVNLSAAFEKGGKPLEGKFLVGSDIGPEAEHILRTATLEAVYYSDGKARRKALPKDEQSYGISGPIRWTGLDMQYFSIIAIPDQPLPYFEMQRKTISSEDASGDKLERSLLKIMLPVNGALDYRMYIGPKKQSDLAQVKAADITGAINYGMFSIIVLPLLSALQWIHLYITNYGLAIIILTFLLSLLLFPFRLKQMLSMKKMQVVQPEVKAIQERYKRQKKQDAASRAEMNQEVMALYKKHNVNPLGGCLPLLLQFPILIAFYNLLANSIELRHAPFILWIFDLSIKDPYYVIPVVMGITSFISQKMTPMSPGQDPSMNKAMMFMPLMLTVIFINMSSGLNLYFLCSNIFQIGFQKITERWIGGGKSSNSSKA
jgi:YidC/Oxa1 family membrane protein insertase